MNMKKYIDWFINLYAVWIIASFAIGFYFPDVFLWFSEGSWMTAALALVMLGMGLTLNLNDFKALLKIPKAVFLGAVSQYTILPFSGWLVSRMLQLPSEFAVGLILLACCPAGTASNLINYIGKGNVALSVTMTAVSTILAIVMTPMLSTFIIGQYVPVDAIGLLLNVLQIVLIPVSIGVLLNTKFPHSVKKLGQTGPVVSTWAIIFISGAIIAPAATSSREILIEYVGVLLLASALLHSFGFGLGYVLARICRFNAKIARTVSIETGMQNGGLAAVLARNNFTSLMPLVAVPAVFCSVVQTVLGGILATIWRLTVRDEGSAHE
jgi:BASS family bile acid:Na+ symporter